MSSQFHLWLRIGALALLVTCAVWPRATRGHGADGMTAAEVMRGASDSVMAPRPTRSGASRPENAEGTSRAATRTRLVSAPRITKTVVAEADESQLNN